MVDKNLEIIKAIQATGQAKVKDINMTKITTKRKVANNELFR